MALPLCHKLAWDVVVADVKFPIIGADFLCHYGLLVDVRHNTLLDATTFVSVNGTVSQIHSVSPIMVESCKSEYLNILTEFPSITKPVTQETSVKHNITLALEKQNRNSITSWNWESYNPLSATGHLLCKWFPRTLQECGDRVGPYPRFHIKSAWCNNLLKD